MLVYKQLDTVLSSEDTVLDVGAGTASRLTGLPGRTIALDIVRRPERDTQEAVIGDGCHLPFNDRTFDYVVSNQVLEHVRDKEAYVGEAARVLGPTGELLIAFPNRYWPLAEHDTAPFLSILPRTVGTLVSNWLLSERQHAYYTDHLYPIGPVRGRELLERHFEEVQYVTVDLVRDLDLRGTPWERPGQILHWLPTKSRLVRWLAEGCGTYLAYRCTGPRDARRR